MFLPCCSWLNFTLFQTYLHILFSWKIAHRPFSCFYVEVTFSLKLYLQSDLVINQNLFFTFTDEKGRFDIRQLTSIIKQFVKPSIDTEMAGYLQDIPVHDRRTAGTSDLDFDSYGTAWEILTQIHSMHWLEAKWVWYYWEGMSTFINRSGLWIHYI